MGQEFLFRGEAINSTKHYLSWASAHLSRSINFQLFPNKNISLVGWDTYMLDKPCSLPNHRGDTQTFNNHVDIRSGHCVQWIQPHLPTWTFDWTFKLLNWEYVLDLQGLYLGRASGARDPTSHPGPAKNFSWELQWREGRFLILSSLFKITVILYK